MHAKCQQLRSVHLSLWVLCTCLRMQPAGAADAGTCRKHSSPKCAPHASDHAVQSYVKCVGLWAALRDLDAPVLPEVLCSDARQRLCTAEWANNEKLRNAFKAVVQVDYRMASDIWARVTFKQVRRPSNCSATNRESPGRLPAASSGPAAGPVQPLLPVPRQRAYLVVNVPSRCCLAVRRLRPSSHRCCRHQMLLPCKHCKAASLT